MECFLGRGKGGGWRGSGKAPKGWEGGEAGAERAKRSLKHTGARPVDGGKGAGGGRGTAFRRRDAAAPL